MVQDIVDEKVRIKCGDQPGRICAEVSELDLSRKP